MAAEVGGAGEMPGQLQVAPAGGQRTLARHDACSRKKSTRTCPGVLVPVAMQACRHGVHGALQLRGETLGAGLSGTHGASRTATALPTCPPARRTHLGKVVKDALA